MTGQAARGLDPSRQGFVVAAFFSVYVLSRTLPDFLVAHGYSPYFSYVFEAAFVLVVYGWLRRQITLWQKPTRRDGAIFFAMGALGFLIYRAAGPLGIAIPFDLTGLEMALLLVVLSPLLEELIFRLALWECFRKLGARPALVLGLTTLLFAVDHLAAYWTVPAEVQPFVLYQTLYVLILGAVAGGRRLTSGAVSSAIWVHFGFNLGFYLAA